MSSIQKKHVITSAVAISAAVLIAVIFIFVRGARLALIAEKTSWATGNTCNIIAIYISTSDSPHWPTSWDDLESVTWNDQWPYWPEDRAYYESNVHIDFDLSLIDVATMTQENFNAIEAIGPHYGFQEYWYLTLIEAAQEAITNNP
ncbi:MAG: hypothetical protein RLN78_11265 [Phycisphaerales bacterium]